MDNLAEEKRFTYKDYAGWDDDIRYELIEGVPYAMAAPSQIHQEISRELLRQFANFLRGKPCKVFAAPFAVRLNFDSYDDVVVEPDILVVCDKSKLDGKSVNGAPDLIIEILSPFNIGHDTIRKFRQYQKAGVKEYWIVNPIRKIVELHILKNGKYSGVIYRDDDIIPVHTLEGCEINLAEIFYGIEPESDEIESLPKQKIVEAMKENGISEEQIEKIINSLILIY